ncbi:MAG: hypothetical protein WEB13_09390 [Dehalococcoidia bacterium]
MLKPLGQFHRMGDGHQAWCKPCRKAWDADYWVRQRVVRIRQQKVRLQGLREWIRSLKSSQPCADCGGYFHWIAMTYDHLPGSAKRGEISNLIAGGYRRVVEAELEKCELVCANCHAVRTYLRREKSSAPPDRRVGDVAIRYRALN